MKNVDKKYEAKGKNALSQTVQFIRGLGVKSKKLGIILLGAIGAQGVNAGVIGVNAGGLQSAVGPGGNQMTMPNVFGVPMGTDMQSINLSNPDS